MCTLEFAGLNEYCIIDDIEAKIQPQYTYNLIEYFKSGKDKFIDDFWWIITPETFKELLCGKWYNSEKLINENKFIILIPDNLSDDEYNRFKKQVVDSDFKYDQQSEKVLSNLKEIAEFEGYLEGAKEEFDTLEKKLTHNLDRDLDFFKEDIKRILSIEIVKRYYYQKGAIQQQLKDDVDIKEALSILKDPNQYSSILSPSKEEKKD